MNRYIYIDTDTYTYNVKELKGAGNPTYPIHGCRLPL